MRTQVGGQVTSRILAGVELVALGAVYLVAAKVETVAKMSVPFLADWCAIDLVRPDSSLERVALSQRDQQTPPAEVHPQPRNGHKTAGSESTLCVRLEAHGEVFGTITLGMAESGRRYGPREAALANELAHRASLVVENARLFAALQKSNEAKDEFLGMVSHELRTPLTTISGGVRLLRTRADRIGPEAQRELLADIEHETGRLARLVEDLLLLARLELDEPVREPVAVQRTIKRVSEEFRRANPRRTLVANVEEGLVPVAAGELYLGQVLENLITNADKYSPPEAPVQVCARLLDSEVVVSVLDRGPGIPQEEATRIFDRFFRSKETARKVRGTGIGLMVCKRLVEAQGGRIWAQARAGGGLEVSFSLPAYVAEVE